MSDASIPSKSFTEIYERANRHGCLIGVLVAIVLGFFFLWLSWEDRQLCYSVRSNRSILFDAENPLGFKVVPREAAFYAGPIVLPKPYLPDDENIYLTQVLIWNAGNVSIKPDNILEKIGLTVGQLDHVLDTRVIKASRPDSVNASVELPKTSVSGLEANGDGAKSPDRIINWSILEPNDFAIIQVTYAGDKDAEISVSGVIEGLNTIKRVDDSKNMANALGAFFGAAIAAVATTILTTLRIKLNKDENKSDRYKRLASIFMTIITFVVSLGLLGLVIVLFKTFGTPFPTDF